MNFSANQFAVVSLSDGNSTLHPEATPLFEKARLSYNLCSIFAWVADQNRRLISLDAVTKGIPSNNAHKNAVQVIPLSHIKGTVNRSDDFDRDFYPRHDRHAARWIKVASLMLKGEILPPVELAQVGNDYFVIDGHHRVSVARMLKYEQIDAVIAAVYEAVK
jgi:hypothetical protein